MLLAAAALLPSAARAQVELPQVAPPPGETPLQTPAPAKGGLVVGGDFAIKLQGEANAPNRSKTRVGLYSDAELQLYANYRDWLSVNSDIKLERTRNTNLRSYFPDRNTFLRSEGVSLRQLYATLRPTDGLSVYAGKIHPAFGSAWGPGMPGTFYNYGTDYEQDERVGFGVQYRLPASLGLAKIGLDDVRLSFEAFYLDTSDLSFGFPRGPSLSDLTASRAYRYARSRFGPSNTGGLNSTTAAIRSGKAGQGLQWQISITQETSQLPRARTENGQSAGLTYDPSGTGIPLTTELGMTPFIEYAHFTNFATVAGLERHYLLAGLSFSYGGWNLAFAGGLRRGQGAERVTDHQENATLTYEILPRLQLGAGINHATLGGRGSWTLAPALFYAASF
jgi:hypothetical protein